MRSSKYLTMAIVAAAMLVSAPAAAQPERGRTGRVADDIVREVENVVDAVLRVSDAVDSVRYRGAERFAIARCAARVERYGRMRVDRVVPYGRRSLRVYGTAGEAEPFGSRYGYRYRAREFTCTVRDDGRVKLRTRRIR